MPLSIISPEQFRAREKEHGFNDYKAEQSEVRLIIDEIREKGDTALRSYTKKFDGAEMTSFKIPESELDEALETVAPQLVYALSEAKENIERFHIRQLRQGWWEEGKGWKLGQRIRALSSVGAYVPGGTAAYPSSVLMTVIPARVAGVKNIYVCTPPDSEGQVNPITLAAAKIAGATAVFALGGVQAVAALAYGTETIPAVQKIVGPGNIYVTLAKKEVFGQVGIDMLAGPSEIVIVADGKAKSSFVAADMLSQAEHDLLSRSILITTERALAIEVVEELNRQLADLPRRDIASRALKERGGIIIVPRLSDAWPLVNEIAPEHLELHLSDPWGCLDRIESAGAVFIGPYSPEPLGDYWAGSNHVLPTGSAARFSSSLGVDDFIRKTSLVCYERDKMNEVASSIALLARAEGLEAHARSALIRRINDETSGCD